MKLPRIFGSGLKRLNQEALILDSGLFDPDWYASQYAVEGGAAKAVAHFLKSNGKYDPSPIFSCQAYFSDNSDVRKAGLNPLLHYLRFGKEEGRVFKDNRWQVRGPVEEFGEATNARLRQLFDADFYRDTNPDLMPDADGFDHFMKVGWRQNRDPAAWFSTEAYLIDHGGLGGKNPFAHYVLTGARAGIAVRASRRMRIAETHVRPGHPHRIGVVAMVKNEADIIQLFASHLLALFDEIVIIDHQSEDGTEVFLADLAERHGQVKVLKLIEPAYIQSAAMTHVLRSCSQLRDADWVFFLDADEFLPFPTRAAFHKALQNYHRCPVISVRWRNIIPETYYSENVESVKEERFLFPPMPSPFQKIALQPSRCNLDQAVVAQGNHALLATLNGLEIEAFEVDFDLLHIPIRSTAQLRQKVDQGVRAYQQMDIGRDAQMGKHWTAMQDALWDQSGQDACLNALAVDYSEEGQSQEPIEKAELISLGFAECSLTIASEPTGVALPSGAARKVSFDEPEARGAVTQLMMNENGDLVRLTGSAAEHPAYPMSAVV